MATRDHRRHRDHYEVIGSGPPLLMYAPGGFDATIDKWSTQGIYAKIKLLDHLPKQLHLHRVRPARVRPSRAGASSG